MAPITQTLMWLLCTMASTAAVTLTYPKYPEHGTTLYLQWTGGTPPYTVQVLTPDLTKYYYRYIGSDNSASWTLSLDAGTNIVFQCTDSLGAVATSPVVTVLAGLHLTYPTNPQYGKSSPLSWSGGLVLVISTTVICNGNVDEPIFLQAPYTVYVLSADLLNYYWKYQGTDTSVQLNININPGTQIVFQVTDSNNIKATSKVVTVLGNGGTSSSSITSVGIPSTSSTSGYTSSQSVNTHITTASTTQTAPHTGSSSTTSVPAQQPDNKGVFNLLDCSECKSKKTCQFKDLNNAGNTTFSIIVGSAVTNCLNPNDPPITTTVGGEYTVEDSWSIDATVGFNLGNLSLEAQRSWTRSTSKTFSQTITLTVNPGYQGVLVARIMYQQTKGTVVLPNGNSLLATSNQPFGSVTYGQLIIPCGTEFQANISAGFQCFSAGLTAKAPSQLMIMCVLAIITALVLV